MLRVPFLCCQATSHILQPGSVFVGISSSFKCRQRELQRKPPCCLVPRNHQQRYLLQQRSLTQFRPTNCRTNTDIDERKATNNLTREVRSVCSNTMSGGAKATIPTTAATPTDTATATAATTVSGPLSDSSFGELEECQHVPPPTAAPEGLKEAIGAAGLAAYSTPLHLTGGSVEERPQRVSRVLQRLCGCSWASAQRLLRLKEAFVVSRDRSPAEHLKQVNDAKHRKRTACGARLQPGSTLYYPRNSSNNSSESSSNTSEEHNCQRQPSAKKELVLFQDEDFIVLNKPCGATIRKLTLPIPLTAPGLPCSGAALLCRSRSAASVVRKAIARGGFGTLKFIAVVEGSPLGHNGAVQIPLRSEQSIGAAVPNATHLGGTPATTRWRLLRSVKVPAAGDLQRSQNDRLGGRYTRSVSILLLETGFDVLPHQIRAHCAFGLRCPLKGDRLYAQLLETWQHEERKMQRSRAGGCLETTDQEVFIRPKEVATSLPLHLKRMQWRTFAGKDVTVDAPLGENLITTLKACGLPTRQNIQEYMRGWLSR